MLGAAGVWDLFWISQPLPPRLAPEHRILSDDGLRTSAATATAELDTLAAGACASRSSTTPRCPARLAAHRALPAQAGVGQYGGQQEGRTATKRAEQELHHHRAGGEAAGALAYAVGSGVTPIPKDGTEPPLAGSARPLFYGTIHGAGILGPNSLVRGGSSPASATPSIGQGNLLLPTPSATTRSVIREHAQRSAFLPFFLYVAYTAAHWPMHGRATLPNTRVLRRRPNPSRAPGQGETARPWTKSRRVRRLERRATFLFEALHGGNMRDD